MILLSSDKRILKYGIISALFYWASTFILMKMFDNAVIFLSFYFPGAIFGFFLTIPLTPHKKTDPATLTIASILIYFFVLLFMNKNLQILIQARQIISPGLGGLLLLTVITKTYSIDSTYRDYIWVFLLGILTTFYSWIILNEFFNPWFLFFSIGLWQITFAFYLNLITIRQSQK